jgi:hypothetical protein
MQSHLALTTGAVDELARAIHFKLSEDEKSSMDSIQKVSAMEMEADRLRRDTWLELAKGDMPPNERDDLLHLSKRVDQIADWARECGRILSVTPLARAPEPLRKILVEMVETAQKCTWSARKSVDALNTDLREALKLADEVERIEEEADELYNHAREYYAGLGNGPMKVGEAILLAQLLESIENISDWCENAIDQVRVIAVRFL